LVHHEQALSPIQQCPATLGFCQAACKALRTRVTPTKSAIGFCTWLFPYLDPLQPGPPCPMSLPHCGLLLEPSGFLLEIRESPRSGFQELRLSILLLGVQPHPKKSKTGSCTRVPRKPPQRPAADKWIKECGASTRGNITQPSKGKGLRLTAPHRGVPWDRTPSDICGSQND
jgi:hypothetical protein